MYRDSVDVATKTARLERTHGFASDFRYTAALKGFAARLTPAQAQRVGSDPDVDFLSLDGRLEVVATVPVLAGDTVPTGVRRIGAATDTTAHQASTVNVAMIDTGIDLVLQPDLNAVEGKNCVSPGASAQDDNGHGTLVAGVIAAKNDGSGVVGVAPGTKLFAVKVLDASGMGSTAQVVCGIDWVTANGVANNINVVNLSLGGPGSNDNNCGTRNGDALHLSICTSVAAGLTYVVAAGNSNANFARFVPASYPEVLTVTAMSDCDGLPGAAGTSLECTLLFPLFGERDDAYASFSNFATKDTEIKHTVAAPGVFILSSWLFGFDLEVSGTSISTPHVTGTIALCFGSGGAPGPCATMSLTPAQVIQKLRSDAAAHLLAVPAYGFVGDPNHQVRNRYYGYLVWAGAY